MARKDWVCTLCGDKTDNPDKVCVVCRTDDTKVKGMVDKKVISGKAAKRPCCGE